MKKLLAIGFCSVLVLNASAQKWVQKMMDPTVNFYDVQKSFNKHWKKEAHEREREREREKEMLNQQSPLKKGAMNKTEEEEENESFMIYKRWEDFMAPRVYPSGDRSLVAKSATEYMEYLQNNSASSNKLIGGNNQIMSSTWAAVGPMGAPAGGNAGRLNVIRFDPTNANTMYVCAPAGGLWVTTNGGTSWTTNTDQLAVIGCSDIAIDPTNTQIMYLATGDGDAGDTPSIGLLKSTNGGTTWSATGLSFAASAGISIRRVKINPNNTQQILVATNTGIYRSTNGGTTFGAAVITNSIRDMELNPLNPNEVFVSGTRFFRSRNFGQSFTQITSGLPANTAVDRMAIGVTPNDTSYVYVIAGDASTSGSYGFYLSTNSGTTFSQVTFASPQNLLGWASAGNDAAAGGQSWYDLAIAVSPTNKNDVVVGGVNIWRTTTAGTSWTLYGHWTGTGAPYIHADCHDLNYNAAGTLYATSDGGVFQRGATTWTDLSAAMNIAQPYRLGLSTSNANLMITGHQDNGTNKYTGTWSNTMGGDGMDCFIDRTNNNVMYGEQYNGSLNRTTNGGGSWTGITTGLTGNAAWVTPWHQDPSVANTIYVGYTQLFKSTNQGTSWAQTTGSMAGTGTIVEFAIAPTNNQIIYVIQGNTLYKTTNGGGAWTNVTGTLPTGSAQMTYVAISPNNVNNVWVTFSGYSAGNKVFTSTNGGTSWTSVSGGLPNLPVNCICYTPGSTTDALYVGCDVGIYYKDNTSANWSPYNTGLPNVPVKDIEIYQPLGKVRAATFGRGVWEVDMYNPGTLAPIANFTANRQVVCAGQTVNFTDLSSFNPTSWSWTFQGGTPAASTAQNPSVVYNTPGTYSVALTATNANGNNTYSQVTYITVSTVNSLPLSEDFTSATFPPVNWTTYDANGDSKFWTRNATLGSQGTTSSMMYDNYNLDAAGSRDEMQAPKYNLSGYTSATLTFDVAYGVYDATYSDTLAVMVSTDCGITFTPVYTKGGSTLASVAGTYTTAVWAPTGATQWRAETVNMNAYAGQSNVMVVFQNRGHFGQALYVDKINLTGVTAGAPPTANFTTSATLCTGQNITFTDASTNSPASWAWTFTGGTPSSSTAQNPVVSYATAGSYTATLTATNANGSSTPYSQVITIGTTPVAAASNTGPFCTGGTISLTSSGGGTYAWTGPGTYTSALQNPTRSGATLGMGGNYTVTVTSGGCSATATTSVSVNVKPVSTVSGSTSFCAGGGVTLSGTTSTPGSGTITGYQWQLGGSNIAGATASTYSATAAGTYNLVVTNSNGCSTTSANKVITVNAAPTATVTGTNSFCQGSNTVLSAASSTAGSGTISGYQWQLGGSNIAGATAATYSATSAGTYNVIVTNSNTCSTISANTVVTVNAAPTANISGATSFCAGSNSILDASASIAGSGTVAGYQWQLGGSNIAGATSATYTATAAGTYNVIVTNSNNCSATSANSIITVNAAPTASISGTSAFCAGGNTILDASGSAAGSGTLSTYQWQLSGSDIAGETAATYTTTAAGTYNVIVSNSNNCSDTSASTVVTVYNLPTVTATILPNDSVCSGTGVTLSGGGATSYSWTGGINDGVSFTPSSTQTYTVTGTDVNNCSNTSTATVTVNNTPSVPVVTQSGLVLTSSSATGNQWYLNGSLLPGETNQTLTVTQNGNYTVVVTDPNGCSSSSSTFTVSNVGVAENSVVNSLAIFPNPNNGMFELSMNLPDKSVYTIQITDVLGQSIFSEQVKNGGGRYTKSFNLSENGSGIYFISISNGKDKMTRKIMVD
ncbi:MAG: PKD domain-containing protein [Bacteroidia bacterium]